jgi:ABC-type uncharacterized transport system permease subunit
VGGQSQLILGAAAASWVGFSLRGMPWLPHVLLAFAAAAVGGALAGLIPGVLKAATGASSAWMLGLPGRAGIRGLSSKLRIA